MELLRGVLHRRRMSIMTLILAQAIILACTVKGNLPESHVLQASNSSSSEKHTKEYCAMYGICGEREDGKVLNCPYSVPSVKPSKLLSSKIQSLCPTITGNVCCTADQFDVLRGQVQQAIPFLVGCPACLRNFLNLFCELACSPNQSLFINVTSISQESHNSTVDGIDFYVTDTFGEELFNSCKEVKFGAMNTRAIDFVGGGARNYREWFAFIGRQAELYEPGSPYSMEFRSTIPGSSSMEPMNISVVSCGDTSLGCSCGDCPSSSICSDSLPPAPHKNGFCSINLGSLKVKCVDFAMAIVYILLVFAIFGWGFLHRTARSNKASSRMKPLLHTEEENELRSVNRSEHETLPVQEQEEVPISKNGMRMPFIQGYISKFYRKHGMWVARNPSLVLAVSIVIVLFLCLGLFRLDVETRPEKVCFQTQILYYHNSSEKRSIWSGGEGCQRHYTVSCSIPVKSCACTAPHTYEVDLPFWELQPLSARFMESRFPFVALDEIVLANANWWLQVQLRWKHITCTHNSGLLCRVHAYCDVDFWVHLCRKLCIAN